MAKTKIIFIGTSEFAAAILEALVYCPLFSVCCAITAPDKPIGRKKEITPPPIKITASQNNLPVLQPKKISGISGKISKLKPDLIITASYGQIIPKSILDIPKFGCINIHPSLLPKYRGPSPIQTAILNGDRTTGITVMLMDEKMDTGPIIAQKKVAIKNGENRQDLETRLSLKSANFLLEILPQYIQGKIKPKKQDNSKASYTKIFSRQDGLIDWKKSAKEIERMIRAFEPWPGVWTYVEQLGGSPQLRGDSSQFRKIKILKAKAALKPSKMAIKTSKGYLLLKTVQPEGKKPMPAQEFFRGLR
ncbi:MAG: methionyl-tRNA formyltransferase [Patescibacteria group bacterium]|nr:methionyl-tRNA formyltransferase [Patescibacteria group bacterium]